MCFYMLLLLFPAGCFVSLGVDRAACLLHCFSELHLDLDAPIAV